MRSQGQTVRGGGHGGDVRIGQIRFNLREREVPPSPTRIRFPDAPKAKPQRRPVVQIHDYDRRAAQPKTTPPEAIDQMVRLYRDGLSVSAVCKETGYSKATVLRYIKEAGLTVRRTTKKDIPIEQMIEDYAAGMSLRQIGKRHGASNTTVRKRLVAAGVKIRSQGEWRKA